MKIYEGHVDAAVEFTKVLKGATFPKKAHSDDACFDLYAAESAYMLPGQTATISTGYRIAMPTGYVGFICSRSGLAMKEGVFVLNAPGVIDAGYRGELKVILHNLGSHAFHVALQSRIGQLFCQKVTFVRAVEVVGFDDETTSRGESGFGSTGK